MSETHCLKCGSARMRRARRRSSMEYAIALAGWRVRRCHGCNTRFLQFGRSLVQADRLKRVVSGLLVAAMATAAVAVVIAAILWFGHSQPPVESVGELILPLPATAANGG